MRKSFYDLSFFRGFTLNKEKYFLYRKKRGRKVVKDFFFIATTFFIIKSRFIENS